MRLHEIGQFYGERAGWRMFDSHTLTPEIKAYLSLETRFVEEIMAGGYDTLLEVGCGYGRYLEFALSRGYDYVGLDIVPWLVQLGEARVSRAREKYSERQCHIFCHSAENLYEKAKELNLLQPGKRVLVLFPFNCLGNVSQFDTVADSLKNSQLDIIVSTFKTDATSTKLRKQYYEKCGYAQLNSRIMKQGLLIVSEEGFHAMAHHPDYLSHAFNKRGFELKTQMVKETVGSAFLFQFADSIKVEQPPKSSAQLGDIEVIAHLLEDDSLENNTSDNDSPDSVSPRKAQLVSGELLTLREITLVCQSLTREMLTGTCSEQLKINSNLRMVLPVVQPAANGLPWYIDLTGQVTVCTEQNAQTQQQASSENKWAVEIKLGKLDSATLEKIGNIAFNPN